MIETSLAFLVVIRCLAVCSPYKYRETQIKNNNKTFIQMFLCILILGVGINIPRSAQDYFQPWIVQNLNRTDFSRRWSSPRLSWWPWRTTPRSWWKTLPSSWLLLGLIHSTSGEKMIEDSWDCFIIFYFIEFEVPRKNISFLAALLRTLVSDINFNNFLWSLHGSELWV